MSVTSLPAVQRAVYTRITGDSATLALVTGVFDAVPDGKAFPYLVIGDATETPDRTMGTNGHEVFAYLTAYTRDGEMKVTGGASGYATGLAIISAALEALCGDSASALTVSGHDVVDVTVDAIDTSRDAKDRQITATVRLWLEDAA